MFEFLAELFKGLDTLDKQVTFVIAVIGFLLSLSSWIHAWTTQRKSLTVTAYEACSFANLVYFVVAIENNSRLPISVNKLTLHYEDIVAPCTMIPKRVLELTRTHGKEIVERKTHYSMDMPVNINALSSATGYILFENLPYDLPTDANKAVLVIGTNRGRKVKKILELPEVRHDPHT